MVVDTAGSTSQGMFDEICEDDGIQRRQRWLKIGLLERLPINTNYIATGK